MSDLIARKGDPSNHGGEIIEGSDDTYCEGSEVARDGDLHACPITGHGTTPITGTGEAKVNGKNIVVDGDVAGCGAEIQAGSEKSYS